MKLIEAVYNNELESVKKLIKAGASLNVKTKYNSSMLILAFINSNIEIIKELIKVGALLKDVT